MRKILHKKYVINEIKTQWQPGLQFHLWAPALTDIKNLSKYTELVGGVIKDFKEDGGYNREDGRHVRSYAIDVEYPRY